MLTEITFKSYELIIASISIVIALSAIMVPLVWNSHRARKKDFEEAMETKADKELFLEKIKNQNLKIVIQETRLSKHEEMFVMELDNKRIESHNFNKSISHVTKRVDEIYNILSSK